MYILCACVKQAVHISGMIVTDVVGREEGRELPHEKESVATCTIYLTNKLLRVR